MAFTSKTALEAGRRGGESTKVKHQSDYYSRIGKMGGEKTKQKGSEFYAAISQSRNPMSDHTFNRMFSMLREGRMGVCAIARSLKLSSARVYYWKKKLLQS